MATVPHTFVAGTTAQAAQVNANFADIYSRFLDKTGDTATGTLNTQHLLPSADETYDLGSGDFQFRDLYLSGTVQGVPGLNMWSTISISGQTDVEADSSGDTLTLAAGDGITLTTTPASDTITIASTGAIAGGSSVVLGQSGTLATSHTTVGNVGTGDDTLWTFTVPANTLNADGTAIWGEAAGTFAANTNNKTLRVKFGSTTILDAGGDTPAKNAGNWVLQWKIKRIGSSSQKVWGQVMIVPNGSANETVRFSEVDYTTAAEDTTGTIAFSVTGEATSNNDIVFQEGTLRVDGVPS